MNVDKYENWSRQVKTELGLMNVDKYEDWSHQVKTELRDKQLWDIVEGTDKPHKAKNDDPAFMAWSQKNAEALKVINRSSKNQFLRCNSQDQFGQNSLGYFGSYMHTPRK